MLQLTHCQQTAYDNIIETFKTKNLFLLTGSAGVGKSSLTKLIANYYTDKGQNICAIAPTHIAKGVIEKFLNENRMLPITAFTVASMLGKIKEHSYIGTKTYSNPNHKKFDCYQLFILDEVSMVSNKDLKFIIAYMNKLNKKLLIIGDDAQLPSPSEGYIITNDVNIIEKANSFIFSEPTISKYHMTEIVRQVKDSPILTLATYIRDHLEEEFDISYENIISYNEAYELYVSLYHKNSTSCKMIAYTNQSVRTHNKEIRKRLNYNEKLMVGDLLTGYANIGWPSLIIQNGMDYKILQSIPTINHEIILYKGLCGQLIDLNIVGTNTKILKLFFIDISHSSNYHFMKELIARAEKTNKLRSSKNDFMRYNALKSKVICMEDIYKLNDAIYTESDFKEKHALLYTKVDEVIKNNEIIDSLLTDKINTMYEGIISERLLDDKVISDSETLADRFKVIEKDIYYGYSVTCHKSQSKSFVSVIVDDNDFKKIQDRINYQYYKLEKRTKEKNQLRYVAVTRASQDLYIVCD